jgi:tRNA dimethylallyltransferase
MLKRSITIVGPTASGKTHRAVCIAKEVSGQIISADSRQVYRGMDLGTGKDLDEYEDVPFHLIDVADAGDKYNLHRYLQDFHEVYDRLVVAGVTPVICGGSGMYVENALNGVRLPEVPINAELRLELQGKSLEELSSILAGMKTLHNTTDIDTCKRAIRAIEIQTYYKMHPEEVVNSDKTSCKPLDSLVIGVDIPRDERRHRITSRLDTRLKEGLIDEVKSLIGSGISPDDLIYYGLEYKYVTLHVIGRLTYEEMFKSLETAIHQFAKRQMTWFRGMEKRGTKIIWLPHDLSDKDFTQRVLDLL